MLKRALFLDRDGVINVDYGYVYKKEEFDFVDGIFDLVRVAKSLGYLVIVVTNQAGIARGYYTEQDFLDLMDWVVVNFENNGGSIDAVYYCPHHSEKGLGKYKAFCNCRKPQPGMFTRAELDLQIDMANSIMIGDKESDLIASKKAGVNKNYLLGGAKNYHKNVTRMDDLIKELMSS